MQRIKDLNETKYSNPAFQIKSFKIESAIQKNEDIETEKRFQSKPKREFQSTFLINSNSPTTQLPLMIVSDRI